MMTTGRAGLAFAEAARTIIGAFALVTAMTTVAFAQYAIPSESMAPTIEVGDRVLVSKFAYGYSRYSLPDPIAAVLPRSDARLFERMPERGDVVVFMHPVEQKVMIKRLIGLPGDVIELRDGRLYVDGAPAPETLGRPLMRQAHAGPMESVIRSIEVLPGGAAHPVHRYPVGNAFEDFGPAIVPPRHLFFMGDNRDNSLDSRWAGMGPVPIENLIGRAETVFLAITPCPELPDDCRARWLRPMKARQT